MRTGKPALTEFPVFCLFKAADWSRTSDLRFTKASLCQLSYGGGQSGDTDLNGSVRLTGAKCSVGCGSEQDLESSGFRFLSFAHSRHWFHASAWVTLVPRSLESPGL